MDKNEILEYIDKLKKIENELSSDEVENNTFLDDLNNLMDKLTKEFNKEPIIPSNDLIVRVKRLHPNAVIPSYSKDGDAGMDLTITEISTNNKSEITYKFGIALEIPRGYVGLIFPRSSVKNYELFLSNCVGMIDSGYRGEIMSSFKKTDGILSKSYFVGDRAAQIMIIPFPKVQLLESDDLSDSERSSGGFGSTGK